MPQLRIAVFGLSITSSWGNGHATTYRGLARELAARGHDVLFLERDVPWYASNRDLPSPPYGRTELYSSLEEVKDRFGGYVRDADAVIVGSYVPEGVAVGEWVISAATGVKAFYDIDTPVTVAKLDRGDEEYLSASQIARYDLYLSFTGGPILKRLEHEFGCPRVRVLHCSVDPDIHYPEELPDRWDLGYIGTYGEDRQSALESLLCEPARRWPDGRFIVAGPQYPARLCWPKNVERVEHLAPCRHRSFYNSQRLTLNVTRADMIRAGYSPSVRLFEAAACGVPIVSDWWAGLDEIFRPGKEILIARTPEESLTYLRELPDVELRRIGERARSRVLAGHTAADRVRELEKYILEAAIPARQAVTTRPRPAPRRLLKGSASSVPVARTV